MKDATKVWLTEVPSSTVALAKRRVLPFIRHWTYSELDFLTLLCSIYLQGIRDGEQVERYKTRIKANE